MYEQSKHPSFGAPASVATAPVPAPAHAQTPPGWSAHPHHSPAPAQGIDFSTGVARVAGLPVSSAGKRFGAYLLDVVLCGVTLGIGWLIWSLVVWSKGQTPGKSLLGMRCVQIHSGRGATWGTMALRELVGKSLLGMVTFGITSLVGSFMVLGATRQGLWDKVASTTVVDDPQGRLVSR